MPVRSLKSQIADLSSYRIGKLARCAALDDCITVSGREPLAEFSIGHGLSNLFSRILQETKTGVMTEPQYYRDTDGYSTFKTKTSFRLWAPNLEIDLTERSADAWGPVGHRQLDEGLLGFATRLSETVSISGAMGGAYITDHSDRLIGNFNTTFELARAWVSGSFFRDVVDTTAQTIGNRIVETGASFSLQRKLFHGLTAHIDYNYSDFSDSNHANRLQTVASYPLDLGPIADTIGYRFRFADFARATSNGYFTPAGLTSHEAVNDIAFTRPGYYAAAEVALGHRSFDNNGTPNSDFTATGSLSAGVTPTKSTWIEVRAEGGNYEVGLRSPWSYFMAGLKASYVF